MAGDGPIGAPDGGPRAFERVLGAPGVMPLALASVVARLPMGMSVLALVFYIEHVFGSFAAAGIATAALTSGTCLTSPSLARVYDRRGGGFLLPTALLANVFLASTVLLGQAGAALWSLIAVAFLAGASMPPLGGVIRQQLPNMVATAEEPTIFALDSILIEVIFVLGPLAAGLLASTAGPAWAVLVSALTGAVGTTWLVLELPPHPHHERPTRPRGGALSSPGIRVLVLSSIPAGAAFGALEIALPAFGAAQGNAALGGPLGAALAVGSVVGGILYGTNPRALGPPQRAIIVLGLLGVLFMLPLLIWLPFWPMLLLAILAGLPSAPAITARSEIVRQILPRGTGTESFTWITVSLMLGYSVGSLLTGFGVEAGGWRLGFALAVALSLIAVALVVAGRHRFEPGHTHDRPTG